MPPATQKQKNYIEVLSKKYSLNFDQLCKTYKINFQTYGIKYAIRLIDELKNGKKNRHDFNDEILGNKKERKELMQSMKNRYSTGQILSNVDSYNAKLIFQYHPRINEICKNNDLSNVIIIKGDECFIIQRTDNTWDYISYYTAIYGTSKWKYIQRAARNAVRNSIIEFRDKIFTNKNYCKCPLTGEYVSKDNCHIDHYEPKFKDIVEKWMYERSYNENDIIIQDNPFGGVQFQYSTSIDFVNFHDQIAQLRITSQEGNLKRKT